MAPRSALRFYAWFRYRPGDMRRDLEREFATRAAPGWFGAHRHFVCGGPAGGIHPLQAGAKVYIRSVVTHREYDRGEQMMPAEPKEILGFQ